MDIFLQNMLVKDLNKATIALQEYTEAETVSLWDMINGTYCDTNGATYIFIKDTMTPLLKDCGETFEFVVPSLDIECYIYVKNPSNDCTELLKALAVMLLICTQTRTNVVAPLTPAPVSRCPFFNATAPSATAPSATAPSATAPSATAPSTTAPSATAPSATAPSATAPSATAPSTTAPSTTQEQLMYKNIIDRTIDAIITIDEYGKVQSFNQGAEAMFGYKAVEVINHNINMLMPEPHHSKHDGYLKQYRETGKKSIIDTTRKLKAKRADESVFTIELSVGQINNNYFAAIIRDITVHESVSDAKELFVANMSHEIRTPLNGIYGITQVMKDYEKVLPREFVEYINIIENCNKHLLSIVNDILDYSKITAGCMELQPRVFDLISSIEHCHDTVISTANNKRITLNHVFAENVPQMVYADEQRINQVIINLLSNAVKFTSHGSVITKVSCKKSGGDDILVSVAVEDTGCGIPRDKINHIFSVFGQIDNTYTKTAEGTGLGLSISYKIAEIMKGKLLVNSTVDKGSTFTFTFPAKYIENIDGKIGSLNEKEIKVMEDKAVLVIDDNANNRMAIFHMLKVYKIRTTLCAVPEEALAMLESGTVFDLILMDVCMPQINGIELSHRIRTLDYMKSVPIIAISSIDEVFKYRSLFDDTLIKPLKRSILLRSIITCIMRPAPTASSPPPTASSPPPKPPTATPPAPPKTPTATPPAPPKPPTASSPAPPKPPTASSPAPPKPPTASSPAPPKPPTASSPAPPKTPTAAPPAPPKTPTATPPQTFDKADNYSMYFCNALDPVKESIFNKEKILVIEDNISNVYIMDMFLKSYGYSKENIDVANNGLDGVIDVAQSIKNQYQVILMDLKMPYVNGHMCIGKIRELYPDPRLPPFIIAVSASILESDKEKCRENGVTNFVTKPVDRAKLHAALKLFVSTDDVKASKASKASTFENQV